MSPRIGDSEWPCPARGCTADLREKYDASSPGVALLQHLADEDDDRHDELRLTLAEVSVGGAG